MNRTEKIAVYERIIRDNDVNAFAIAWHDGLVGAPNATNWRDWYRAWMRVKEYPTMWEYPDAITKQYKISVCTVSGNRLLDIKQTLPANIKDSEGYPAEFILVDYGSTDGLEEWVKAEMMHHIDSGLLTFYRTVGITYFDHPHSKNVAWRLGTGEILMNLDADNFIQNRFLEKVNLIANHIPERMVVVQTGKTHGNIALYRDDFYAMTGYDQALRGRAPSAFNLQLRCLEQGFTLGYYRHNHRAFTDIKYPYAANMPGTFQDYKKMHDRNTFQTYLNVMLGKTRANPEGWGKATLIKNFKEEVCV